VKIVYKRTNWRYNDAVDPEFRPLGRSIGRTAKFVRAWGDRELAPIGSSVTEWILLFHVASAPAPGMSQTEIARFSDMGGPALVRHIDRLERDGIVRRTRDESDRRVMRVTITAKGRRRLDEIAVVMARCDRKLREVLTAREQDVLQGALDKVFEFVRAELHGDRPALHTTPGGVA
jgi:MarR family transcriptional regulator for hemolysin